MERTLSDYDDSHPRIILKLDTIWLINTRNAYIVLWVGRQHTQH
jgi:hypothetical protein